jgi:hypothetical protein
MERLISRGLADLISPGMDDGFSVEVIEVGEDPRLEFILGCDAKCGAARIEPSWKKPPTRSSQDPCFGGKYKRKTALGWTVSQVFVSLEMCAEWLSRITLIAVSVG